MLLLAYRKIIENKKRLYLTVTGVAISAILLIISSYYFYIGNTISLEQMKTIAAEQRILYKLVRVNGTVYSEVNGYMVPSDTEIYTYMEKSLQSLEEIEDIVSEYEIFQPLYMDMENGARLMMDMPYGVDVQYNTFPAALMNLLELEKAVKYGRNFKEGDYCAALMSETTMHYLGLQPEQVIGSSMVIKDDKGASMEITIVGIYPHELSGYYRFPLEELGTYFYDNEYNSYGADFIFSSDVIQNYREDGKNGPDMISVSVYSTDSTEELIELIADTYHLSCSSDYQMYYETILQSVAYSKLILLLGGVTLFVVFLMVASTLLINISEQLETIKLYILLGMKYRQICMVFFAECLMYGGTGALAGSFIGYLGTVLIGSNFAMNYGQVIDSAVFLLPIRALFVVIALLLGICIFLGLSCSIYMLAERRKMTYYGER